MTNSPRMLYSLSTMSSYRTSGQETNHRRLTIDLSMYILPNLMTETGVITAAFRTRRRHSIVLDIDLKRKPLQHYVLGRSLDDANSPPSCVGIGKL
jgi:hypothetical protein